MSKTETQIWIEVRRIEASIGESLNVYGHGELVVDTNSKVYARARTKRALLAQLRRIA